MTKENHASIWRFAISDIACLALGIILGALAAFAPINARAADIPSAKVAPAPLLIPATFLDGLYFAPRAGRGAHSARAVCADHPEGGAAPGADHQRDALLLPGGDPRVQHRKPERRDPRRAVDVPGRAARRPASPRWSTSPRTFSPISADPDQIRQVVWNLVSNAIQAVGGEWHPHRHHAPRRPRGGNRRGSRGERHRRRNPARRGAQHLQPVLYHEGEGDRPRASHRPRHRREARGDDPSGQPGGDRCSLLHLSPALPEGGGDQRGTGSSSRCAKAE